MKQIVTSLNIPEVDEGYEGIASYTHRNHMANDYSGKVLSILYFSVITQQLQARSFMLGICYRKPENSWHLSGQLAGHMENSKMQSMGHSWI